MLHKTEGSPIVSLNYAVAVAMSESLERGLDMMDELGGVGELDTYHLYHAGRADLLRRMERNQEALASYHRALALTTNAVELRYLRRRISEVEAGKL